MNKRWIVDSLQTLEGPVQELYHELEAVPHELIIRPYKRDGSEQMRKLYRVWVRCISEYTGNDEDYQHNWLKDRFLVPVLLEHDESFKEMSEHVMTIWKAGMKPQARAIKQRMVEQASTVGLPIKPMSEYMDSVEKWAMNEGISLPKASRQ